MYSPGNVLIRSLKILPVRLVAYPVIHDLLGRTDDHEGIGIDLLCQSLQGTDFANGDNCSLRVNLFAEKHLRKHRRWGICQGGFSCRGSRRSGRQNTWHYL